MTVLFFSRLSALSNSMISYLATHIVRPHLLQLLLYQFPVRVESENRIVDCPLGNECQTACVVYRAQITSDNKTHTYVGLTEGPFKKRYSNHKSAMKNETQILSSELSKKIWALKDENKTFHISSNPTHLVTVLRPWSKTSSIKPIFIALR